MNAIFTQDKRLGKLTTVLGKDTLVLLRFDGVDHMNDLFEYRVEALSTEPNIDFDGLIGTHASVEIESQNNGTRIYDGLVTEAKWAGVGENGNKYTLTLRPWLWVAGQRRNQRIFHNKTVVQILEELLAPYGGLGDPALDVALSGSCPELEYTVQYRESDLAFATRLMERFGINYHFAHKVGSHTLVLTDTVDAHPIIPGGSREYKPVEGARQANKEHFWEWHPERRMTTGAIRLTDYNFKKPTAAMEVERAGDAAYAQGQTESYDYPGDYHEQGLGKDVVGLRILQERGQDARHRAVGDCTSLGAGMKLTLTGDQVNGVKGADYLCLSASHSYLSDAYGSGDTTSDGHAYSGAYVLMPVTAPLAPERKTQVPVVHGPQTAVVVGAGEIDCDEYGRILVHFHWDLEKAYSMRCRVSQNWASKGWGGMVIPRIGMEVVVEFLEGDPDKPLVTGCVYNGKNETPYPLPEHKTKSVFRSDTHQGGDLTAFNELSFEDQNGREELFLRASRDMTTKVDQHATTRIDDNCIISIGGHQLAETEKSWVANIGANYAINVGTGSGGSAINGDERKDPYGLRPAAYALNSESIAAGKGNFSISALGTIRLDADSAYSLDVEGAAMERVGQSKTSNVSTNLKVSVGGNSKEVVGRRKVIDAHEEIKIRCGAAVLTMKSDGTITFNGKTLNVSQSDRITMESGRIELN
ncbi:type VI secretion system tip protein TssI/VgrG [Yoonia sp. SS1-5]|uniref:Type VI secretion system Vgr family protein n=1 Tax=Yoonia rhodophyticola TaxID=3137370 RepID=A0AAN0MGS3_9RHOB